MYFSVLKRNLQIGLERHQSPASARGVDCSVCSPRYPGGRRTGVGGQAWTGVGLGAGVQAKGRLQERLPSMCGQETDTVGFTHL